jgi:amidase
MSIFITRFDSPLGKGLRVGVKDLIDMAGVPTTAGCRVLARGAEPATADAACLRGLRLAEQEGRASIVGKTNLHELAFGVTGINPWYGTPPNPLGDGLVPGGSSSGSASAVGLGEADVAIGTDTGGSVRIPAACCGVVGLKTTRGRVPLHGVVALAPSLDTVGPIAATVELVAEGMALLDPGFLRASRPARRLGRTRPQADAAVDAAVDSALQRAGFGIEELTLPGWGAANDAAMVILGAEAWAEHAELYSKHADELGGDVAARLQACSAITASQVESAWRQARAWDDELAGAFSRVDVLAMPTIGCPPPTVEDAHRLLTVRATAPWNLAGLPAIALPVPMAGDHRPASLQLVAPGGGEELLVATAAALEEAIGG